jgi:hypothetical protein
MWESVVVCLFSYLADGVRSSVNVTGGGSCVADGCLVFESDEMVELDDLMSIIFFICCRWFFSFSFRWGG